MEKTTRKAPRRADISSLTGVELTFGEDEIIVSKTDLKGHITYANRVFLKLAGYPLDQLLGAPHCLIRHPHMPRSVFKLLWDTVQSGNEIFAYVINRSANGDHYWVFAHVTPSYDMQGRMVGFHSNRRVANKRIVEGTIIPLYDMLRAEEARHTNPKEAAEAGVALLNRILNDKGVRYDEFIFSLLRAA